MNETSGNSEYETGVIAEYEIDFFGEELEAYEAFRLAESRELEVKRKKDILAYVAATACMVGAGFMAWSARKME